MSEVLQDIVVTRGNSLEAYFLFTDRETLNVITPNVEWPTISCVITVGRVTITKTLATPASLDVVSDPLPRLRLRLTPAETESFPARPGSLYFRLTDGTGFVHDWPADDAMPSRHVPFRVFEPGE